MALQGAVSCQLIKIYQCTFSSNFVEGILVPHLKTKIYANTRAKESDLEIAQRYTYNGENNLTASLPFAFAFEALLCKF